MYHKNIRYKLVEIILNVFVDRQAAKKTDKSRNNMQNTEGYVPLFWAAIFLFSHLTHHSENNHISTPTALTVLSRFSSTGSYQIVFLYGREKSIGAAQGVRRRSCDNTTARAARTKCESTTVQIPTGFV